MIIYLATERVEGLGPSLPINCVFEICKLVSTGISNGSGPERRRVSSDGRETNGYQQTLLCTIELVVVKRFLPVEFS